MYDQLPFLDLASASFSTKSVQMQAARHEFWCARTPFGIAVLRHNHVGRLLRDKRLRQGSHAWPDTQGLHGSFAEFWKRSIISKEGDSHRDLRNLSVPALSPEFVGNMKPAFDAAADALAKQLAAQETCEFMEDFSIPFAGLAICILLDLPDERWEQISHDASDLGLAMGVKAKAFEPTFNAACDRLIKLADELIKRVRNGIDTTSYVARLVKNFDKIGTLDHQALLDMIVISIFGGVDTTRSQLGFAVSLFIQHPDEWQKLRNTPDLVDNAVQEVIQAWPTTTWASREAICDFEFEGVRIKQGTTMHMLVHASARDPAVCDEPTFNISKKRKIHFGFGGGAHHCIGHLMARTDMASALIALSKQFSGFEFDGEPEYLPDSGNTSPIQLPIKLIK